MNNKFKAYSKIHALHKEECDGILIGKCYIQEKIDGANASIWLEDDGIHCGSRTRDLTKAKDDFNGFVTYVNNHNGIKEFFVHNPHYRLYGEWLVRHTIGYKETSYKKFYLFEIEDSEGNVIDIHEMYDIAKNFDIETAHLYGLFDNPTLEKITSLSGNSTLGDKGEGVVIKNLNFVNKFGVKQWGKYVTQEFKEDNALTFGGNNKSSESYCEIYYVNKFMTLERCRKIFHKMESEHGRLDMKNIPQFINTAYYDLITEESWAIAREMGKSHKFFNFKSFSSLCQRKAKKIFIELLTGDMSVVHK